MPEAAIPSDADPQPPWWRGRRLLVGFEAATLLPEITEDRPVANRLRERALIAPADQLAASLARALDLPRTLDPATSIDGLLVAVSSVGPDGHDDGGDRLDVVVIDPDRSGDAEPAK